MKQQILNKAMFKRYKDNSLAVSNYNINQEYTIKPDGSSIKMAVIADTHIGNKRENHTYIDRANSYIANNNIRYVVYAGDLIEGVADPCYSIDKQIDSILNDYFFNRDLTNIVLLGNHDASLLMCDIHDLESAFEETNLKVLGYKCAYIKLCNRYIKLRHQINRMINDLDDYKSLVALYGHTHSYKYRKKENGASIIKLPTLSDNCPDGHGPIVSGFTVLEFFIQNDEIIGYTIEMIDLEKKDNIKKELVLTL